MTDRTTTPQRPPMPTTTTPESRGTTDEARDRASDAADAGKQEAGRVVEEARNHTSRLVGETGNRAREHADERLERAAGVIEEFGSELDGMVECSPQPDGYVAALARDGAQTAHKLSRRLEDGGLDGVIDDVTRFARRRPGAFLAASFAVGMVLGRVTRNADMQQIKQDVSDNDSSSKNDNSSSNKSLPSADPVGGPVRSPDPIGGPARSPSANLAGGPSTSPGITP